jgi:hypothetical protein
MVGEASRFWHVLHDIPDFNVVAVGGINVYDQDDDLRSSVFCHPVRSTVLEIRNVKYLFI